MIFPLEDILQLFPSLLQIVYHQSPCFEDSSLSFFSEFFSYNAQLTLSHSRTALLEEAGFDFLRAMIQQMQFQKNNIF